MKKFYLILIIFLSSLGVSAQHTYVLMMAVSKYSDTTNQYDLPASTRVTKEIKKTLEQQPNTTVTLVTGKNVSPQNMRKKLNAIIKLAKSNDKIYFFFNGHGGDDGCIYCYNLQPFYYSELIDIFSKARTKNIFCFIEACFSGTVKEDANYGSLNNGDPVFMMSSRANEVTWSEKITSYGHFTRALVKGLRGKCDANGDKKITLRELYKYVYNDVVEHIQKQHPQLIGPSSLYDTVITKW